MQRQILDCEVRAKSDGDRILSFVGTTATRDRMGDEIAVSGWDLKHYKKNPVFLWAHNYSELPIGRTNHEHDLKFQAFPAVESRVLQTRTEVGGRVSLEFGQLEMRRKLPIDELLVWPPPPVQERKVPISVASVSFEFLDLVADPVYLFLRASRPMQDRYITPAY